MSAADADCRARAATPCDLAHMKPIKCKAHAVYAQPNQPFFLGASPPRPRSSSNLRARSIASARSLSRGRSPLPLAALAAWWARFVRK
jgi:hypothetical protein